MVKDKLDQWLDELSRAAADDLARSSEMIHALREYQNDLGHVRQRLVKRLQKAAGGQTEVPGYPPTHTAEEPLDVALSRLLDARRVHSGGWPQ